MKLAFVFLLILIFFLSTCSSGDTGDNISLKQLVIEDQQDRKPEVVNPSAPRDDERRKKVFGMLANGQVRTPQDKLNAALILQHTGMVFIDGVLKSKSVENHYLAYRLAASAASDGLESARYLSAVTYDRYTWMTIGVQKYGTQSTWVNNQEVWVAIDSTTSDAERAKFDVPPLAELLDKMPVDDYPN